MACSDVYPAGARDHVTELNDEMLAELQARSCPRCGCHESRPVEGDDQEVASLPLRVCVACNDVFGFDDSTSVPEHLLPPPKKTSCSGIWEGSDNEDAACPRQSSPCFRDADAVNWSSGHEDDAVGRDHDHHHSEFSDQPRRGRGRGKRGCSGGCGHGRGRGHHHGEDRSHHHHHHHHHHRHCGRGRSQRCHDGGSNPGSTQASSNGGDRWQQVAATCAKSCTCLLGAATDVAAGRYDGAVATVSDQMEPIGRAFGSAVGSAAGEVIGSPRAGEIAAGMGSTVGRGVAEMLKESSLCSSRTSSHHD